MITNMMSALLIALATVESGGKDGAVGKSGEVSRYQIMPYVWRAETTSRSYRNPDISKTVATRILTKRMNHFMRETRRQPTPAEAYALWHRPGDFEKAGWRLKGLSTKVQQRCQRYEALVFQIAAEKKDEAALDRAKMLSQK